MTKEIPFIFRVCDNSFSTESAAQEYMFANAYPTEDHIYKNAQHWADMHNKMCVVYKPILVVPPTKMFLKRSKKK